MQRGRRGPLPFVHQPLRPLAAVGEGKKKEILQSGWKDYDNWKGVKKGRADSDEKEVKTRLCKYCLFLTFCEQQVGLV